MSLDQLKTERISASPLIRSTRMVRADLRVEFHNIVAADVREFPRSSIGEIFIIFLLQLVGGPEPSLGVPIHERLEHGGESLLGPGGSVSLAVGHVHLPLGWRY